MRILLSSINANRFFTPLAPLYLKAFLLADRYLKEKIKVEIKEFSQFDSDDFILWEIKKSNPEIIGFSCYIWNIKKILTLSLKIKKLNRNTRIILGGPQVSPIAETILEENNQIDFIVRGEGEVTFKELIKTLLDSKKNLDMVSGITYRDNSQIVNNLDREIIPDLDSIPSVYICNFTNLKNREVCLETQRGCVFKCHFCYYNKGFDKIRFFSMQRTKRELSFLLRQKLTTIYLMDPVFNLNMKRAKEICRFIIGNNKNNIPFHTEIKAEFIDDELAELFSKANIKYLEIGLQSTKNKVLSLVNRKLNLENFANGINLLKKYDFKTEVQLILGLPGDTFYSFKRSLEFVLNLQPKALSIFRLQVLPGTEIWNKARELGIIYEDEPPHYFLQSKTLSFDEVIQLEKIKNSLNLFRTKKTIEFLCKETKIKLLDIIELWVNWLKDDKFLLSFQDSEVLKKKFRRFIKYLCKKNNIDFNFYDAILQRETTSSTKPKKRTKKQLFLSRDKDNSRII